MLQRWHNLLFAHWSFDPAEVRHLVPPQLELDTFDGRAWVGIVPFTMSGVRVARLPPVPGTHAFHEVNVRTYASFGGEPGVWFFSLDAASRLAVRAARRFFHLPYYDARMQLDRDGDDVRYASLRVHRDSPWASLDCAWRAGPSLPPSESGDLQHFLTERYCLYALAGDHVVRGRIQHEPWPLRTATLTHWKSSMLTQLGLDERGTPEHLACADLLAVEIEAPRTLSR